MIEPASLDKVYRTSYGKVGKISRTEETTSSAVSPAAEAQNGSQDEICISAEGNMLQTAAKATALAGSIPQASAERLNALRDQINSGNYNISSADVAESMLSRGL